MNALPSTIRIRKSSARGGGDHGWLHSRHTFSFADYRDPAFMGFRSLRVLNEDRVAPSRGFPTHPHRDMEIFSYVLQGELSHRDSMGNERVLTPGQVQLMSAGTGVSHSEFNPSPTAEVHFLQIWIQPSERGLAPTYTEWLPNERQQSEPKVLMISPDGRENSAHLRQDAFVYRLLLSPGETVSHSIGTGRGLWLQMVRGKVLLGDDRLATGDGASVENVEELTLSALEPTEALLIDLN